MSYYPESNNTGGYPNQSGYPNQAGPYDPAGTYQQGYGAPLAPYPQDPAAAYPQAPSAPYTGEYQQQQQQQGYGGPGGFPDPSQLPVEDLPPGYNPATRAPYQANELPYGASPAPEGYEGYIPQNMSREEAQERGFLGATGGGLLGAWLGRKFGKKHGHGFLGMLGGAGAGGFLGNKIF